LEYYLYSVHRSDGAESMVRDLRKALDGVLNGRSEVVLYNVLQLMPVVNPLVATRYYIFKRYSRMLYQSDALQAAYLALHLNFGRLLIHTIVLGLERQASRRKQGQFLKMIREILARLTT